MVFKNGGQLSKHEHWHYSGKDIEVVKGFDNVGVSFYQQIIYVQNGSAYVY
jgi:hypothetical protein